MLSEFDHIEKLRNHFNLAKIGDDCAVLPKNAQKDLLISADLLVEDIDFSQSWAKPEEIGHKALAVSLSDIAAMGGDPQFGMISIGVPESIWNSDFLDRFYEGWFNLAKAHNVELIGGDTSKTPDKIVVDSIVLGEVDRGAAVLRSGAKVGDLIYVSGRLGGASAGLQILQNTTSPEKKIGTAESKLINQQLKPTPHIQYGKLLQKHELATAMIDLSDGLSSDLNHICKASDVGAKIHSESIPIDEDLSLRGKPERENLSRALNGGEDFELLFTVNPENISSNILKDSFLIGEITPNDGTIELIVDGKPQILRPDGYSHF